MDTSGFYKNDNNNLLYGPNFVEHRDFKLERQFHETYTYPIHGWYWFDTEEEAREALNIPKALDLTPPSYAQYDPFVQQ